MAKSDYLGQVIVTPEMIAKKIMAVKDNKSPGVDEIPPKPLMETVEQINILHARVFNFKKGSRNKLENYRPVSLIGLIYKLLLRLIKDPVVDFLVRDKLLNPSQHGFLKATLFLTNMLCFF